MYTEAHKHCAMIVLVAVLNPQTGLMQVFMLIFQSLHEFVAACIETQDKL